MGARVYSVSIYACNSHIPNYCSGLVPDVAPWRWRYITYMNTSDGINLINNCQKLMTDYKNTNVGIIKNTNVTNIHLQYILNRKNTNVRIIKINK
jgi:hypothetical protein